MFSIITNDDDSLSCQRCFYFQSAVAGLSLSAYCPECGRPLTDATPRLTGASIERSLLEILPESVIRENLVVPLRVNGNTVLVADIASESNCETVRKLFSVTSEFDCCVHADGGALRKVVIRAFDFNDSR